MVGLEGSKREGAKREGAKREGALCVSSLSVQTRSRRCLSFDHLVDGGALCARRVQEVIRQSNQPEG